MVSLITITMLMWVFIPFTFYHLIREIKEYRKVSKELRIYKNVEDYPDNLIEYLKPMLTYKLTKSQVDFSLKHGVSFSDLKAAKIHWKREQRLPNWILEKYSHTINPMKECLQS